MKSHSERTGLVQSIERAFSIIEALKEHQELGIAELSAQLSLDRSTVHRLLATLRVLGYVDQNRENFKYSNSLKFFDIGHSVVRSLGLGRIAMPFMKALAEETQVGINLAVMESYSVVYIEKIESQSTIRATLPLGVYMPAYCTGLGKMLLSCMDEKEIRDVFRSSDEAASRSTPHDNIKLRRYTANTITNLDLLCEELANIRKRGYSLDDEEYISGLYCIAVPIRDYQGRTVAAMSAVLLKIIGTDIQSKAQDVLKKLTAAAGSISASLGYH